MAQHARKEDTLLCSQLRWQKWTVSGLITVGLAVAFLVLLHRDTTQVAEFFELPFSFDNSIYVTASICLSVLFIALYVKNIGIDLFGALLLAFVGVVGISTLINQGDMGVWARDWLPCAGVALIVGALARARTRELLRAVFFASTFYLLCNLVWILATYQGFVFDSAEFLVYGYRNITFILAIPAVLCSLLLDRMAGLRCSHNTVIVYLLGLVELLVGYSATSMVAYVLSGAAIALVQFRWVRIVLNGLTYYVAYVAAFLGIVIFRIQDQAAFFIEGVLHRSVTFTGRTAIWDTALQLCSESHLWTGYGASYVWNLIEVNGQLFKHAHNEVLHVALAGGVVAVALLAAVCAVSCVVLFKRRQLLSSAYVAAAIGAFLLIGLVEEITLVSFFFVLALGVYFAYRNEAHSSKNLWRLPI